jgi:hypothetical protein
MTYTRTLLRFRYDVGMSKHSSKVGTYKISAKDLVVTQVKLI